MPPGFWALYVEKLAIVALILAALYFGARRLRQARLFAPSGRLMQVLESTMLSPHAMLHVVRAGSRYFLIGSTAAAVTSLAELEAREVTTSHPSTGSG